MRCIIYMAFLVGSVLLIGCKEESDDLVDSTITEISWNQINGPGNADIITFFSKNGYLFIGTRGSGIFRSSNDGDNWTPIDSGLTDKYVYAFTSYGTNLFAGTANGGVYLSTNNGTNWTAVNSGLPNLYVISLAVSGSNIFAGGSGIYLSTDNGTKWTNVNPYLANQCLIFRTLAFSGTDIFAGLIAGFIHLTDNGQNYSEGNSGLTNTYVNIFANNGNNLFAGTSGGLFLSTNNGHNWATIDSGLTSTYIYTLAFSGKSIFAGTAGGVFRSTNNGNLWSAINSGLSSPNSVNALVISNRYLIAALYGGKIYRARFI